MLRRYVSAGVVLLVVAGFVLADTVRGLITAASDKEVTINVREKGKKGKGEPKTFTVSKETKVLLRKGKDTEPTDATIDDLKKAIEKARAGGKRKGVGGAIETDGEKATKITFGGGGKRRPPTGDKADK
jgi:hypothetical protein